MLWYHSKTYYVRNWNLSTFIWIVRAYTSQHTFSLANKKKFMTANDDRMNLSHIPYNNFFVMSSKQCINAGLNFFLFWYFLISFFYVCGTPIVRFGKIHNHSPLNFTAIQLKLCSHIIAMRMHSYFPRILLTSAIWNF